MDISSDERDIIPSSPTQIFTNGFTVILVYEDICYLFNDLKLHPWWLQLDLFIF